MVVFTIRVPIITQDGFSQFFLKILLFSKNLLNNKISSPWFIPKSNTLKYLEPPAKKTNSVADFLEAMVLKIVTIVVWPYVKAYEIFVK